MDTKDRFSIFKMIFLSILLLLLLTIGGTMGYYLSPVLPFITPYLLVLIISSLTFGLALSFKNKPSKLQVIISIFVGLFAIVASVYYDLTFFFLSIILYGGYSDTSDRLSQVLSYIPASRIAELINLLFFYLLITIAFIYSVSRSYHKKIMNSTFMIFYLLLLLLIMAISSSTYLTFNPLVGTLFMIVPLIVGIHFYRSLSPSPKRNPILVYSITLPIISLFLGILFNTYIIRYSCSFQIIFNRIFVSNDRYPLLLGTAFVILLASSYIFYVFRLTEREDFA